MNEPVPWQVRFTPHAKRAVMRLPNKIAAAAVEFITVTLPTNPHKMSKPLRDDLAGYRSARRGDYRVLFHLDDESRLLYVDDVAHRADIYRPR